MPVFRVRTTLFVNKAIIKDSDITNQLNAGSKRLSVRVHVKLSRRHQVLIDHRWRKYLQVQIDCSLLHSDFTHKIRLRILISKLQN